MGRTWKVMTQHCLLGPLRRGLKVKGRSARLFELVVVVGVVVAVAAKNGEKAESSLRGRARSILRSCLRQPLGRYC